MKKITYDKIMQHFDELGLTDFEIRMQRGMFVCDVYLLHALIGEGRNEDRKEAMCQAIMNIVQDHKDGILNLSDIREQHKHVVEAIENNIKRFGVRQGLLKWWEIWEAFQ